MNYQALVLTIVLTVDLSAAQQDIVVEAEVGRIRGKLIDALNGSTQNVYQFTGIPFAEPPTGSRRFSRPIPICGWSDVFNATSPANICPQELGGNIFTNFTRDFKVADAVVSEDCLQLNLWVPQAALDNSTATRNSTEDLLPVYVFIHGGGFTTGTSMMSTYNGTFLAGSNNIVVVTIQYRVGALGFTYFGRVRSNSDYANNVGLWDQLEALRWINSNIAAFGGNPEKVTLGGESAGAASVAYHLLSPYSRPYFQQAILESGSATAPWASFCPEVAVRQTEHFLKYIGCYSLSTAEALRCLRSISDLSKFTKFDDEAFKSGFGFGAAPVIDEYFVRHAPLDLLRNGEFHKIPILIGANKDEGSWFFSTESQAMETLSLGDKMNFTDFEKLFETGIRITSGQPEIHETVLETAKLIYWPSKLAGYPQGKDAEVAVQATGDYGFLCPTYNLAKTAADKVPVYAYYFTHRSSTSLALPEWMGVMHGDEMMYIFGELFQPYTEGYGFTEGEKDLSRAMMEYVGNFVKTGNPNLQSNDTRSSLKQWPSFSSGGDCHAQYFELNLQTQKEASSPNLCGLKARECSFWGRIYPKLVEWIPPNEPVK